jgi:DNA-binding MarR family transcriptional regulator
MKLQLSPVEIRVIRFLGENYPVTVEDLRRGLSIRPDTLSRTLKALAAKGLIELEPLPDKTYVRLLAPGIVADDGSSGGRAEGGADSSDDDSFMYM